MKLSEKIEELEKEINDLYPRNKINTYSNKRRSLKQSCLNLLFINYSEALLILKRIETILKRKRYLRGRERTAFDGKFKEPWMKKLLHEGFKLSKDLRVDIKSLYLWVYHIKHIFDKCNINIDLQELTRISKLRNKFITHITDSSLFKKGMGTQAGMKMDADCEAPKILFHDLFGKNKISGFKNFIKQAESHIPELKNETNIYEQTDILYRHSNKLSGTLLERANSFINQVGISTEPPAKIADELLKSLKEYRRLKKV